MIICKFIVVKVSPDKLVLLEILGPPVSLVLTVVTELMVIFRSIFLFRAKIWTNSVFKNYCYHFIKTVICKHFIYTFSLFSMKKGPRGIPGLAGVDGPRGFPGLEGVKGEKGTNNNFV